MIKTGMTQIDLEMKELRKKIKKDSDGLKKWKELWVLTMNGD